MADDNRPIKYMRYAIGEIVLVVIGILIALQVNNWNEERKYKIIGDRLAHKLYEETLNNKNNIELEIINLERQLKYLEQLISQGENLDIDLYLTQGQDYWAVKEFSIMTYVLFYTELHTLLSQQYNSAINDGSIQHLSSIELIESLESIQLTDQFYRKLYMREVESNDKMEDYISAHFGHIYNDKVILNNGNWSNKTSKELIRKISTDGGIKFLLQQKQTKLYSKIVVLKENLLPQIENATNTYKNIYEK